jgi:hypothetical protein
MRKLALKSKELYTFWADGCRVGVKEIDRECRDHSCGLLNSLFPNGAVRQLIGGS